MFIGVNELSFACPYHLKADILKPPIDVSSAEDLDIVKRGNISRKSPRICHLKLFRGRNRQKSPRST